MTYITDIAVELGSDEIDNVKLAAGFGHEAAFVRDKIGFVKRRQLAESETEFDLVRRAFERIQNGSGIRREDIQLLMVVTQNPFNTGIPHDSALIQARLGLSNKVMAFDVGLGCSGFVYGLNIASAVMELNAYDCALLITSDCYSRHIDPADDKTRLLFGDAAACTVLQRTSGILKIGPGLFSTDGNAGNALCRKERYISMNGRAVFEFSATKVPAQIRELMSQASVREHNIKKAVLHQGSKFIVDAISRRVAPLGLTCPFYAAEVGNLVSSSIPHALSIEISEGGRESFVISGFGVGLSWGSSCLYKV